MGKEACCRQEICVLSEVQDERAPQEVRDKDSTVDRGKEILMRSLVRNQKSPRQVWIFLPRRNHKNLSFGKVSNFHFLDLLLYLPP